MFDKVNEKLHTTKGKLMVAVPAVMASTAVAPLVAYAAEGDASSAVTESVGLVTSVASLFSTYPMNVFLGFGLAAAAISLFVRAKRGAGGK